MKKINAFFLAVLFLVLCSCATEEHTKNIIKTPDQMMGVLKVLPLPGEISATDEISIYAPQGAADAKLYYEIAVGVDCEEPTEKSTQCKGEFTISSTSLQPKDGDIITLKILAVKNGYENGTMKVQWIYSDGTISSPDNNDAFLKSVTISDANLTFNSNTFVYDNIKVPNEIKSVSLDYIKSNSGATVIEGVQSLQNIALSAGKTTIVTLTVISSDKSTTKRYTFSIYRAKGNEQDIKSSDCTLASLNVEGASIAFDKNKLTYDVTLAANITSTKITYLTSHANAKATIDGSAEFSIVPGVTEKRNITVTAESGDQKVYTVMIYRPDPSSPKSNDATLKSLSVTGGTLSFNPTNFQYDVIVNSASVSVTYKKNHAGATVITNPANLDNISVISGSTTSVVIMVTAEDGVTAITYEVKIASSPAPLDGNACLSDITLSDGSLSFDKNTTEYDVTVENSVSSITVTATPESTKANVVVTPSGVVSLPENVKTPITINVTAEDGTPKTYIVNVTRKLAVNPTPNPNPVPTPVPSTGEYYWTNKNGAVGTNKTIKSWSDWTEAERIAQNAAYDDPRTWKGHQEVPYDVYAMYAAWDNDNLYVMVELVNGVDRANDLFMWHDYASSDNAWWDNRDIPLGMLFNTGKGAKSNKPTVDQGGPIWSKVDFSDAQGFDVMFYHSSKYGYAEHKSAFVGVGTPGFFTTTSAGVFSYGAENCKKFAGATADGSGVHVRYMRKCAVSSKIYMESTPNDNRGTSGQDGAALLASTKYKEFGTTDLDMSYWYTIPLKSLGIDKAYLESTGIGIRQLTTNGGSLMDCSPWDVSMVDVATDPCSDDASTSAEKEDVDDITSAQARVGHMLN